MSVHNAYTRSNVEQCNTHLVGAWVTVLFEQGFTALQGISARQCCTC